MRVSLIVLASLGVTLGACGDHDSSRDGAAKPAAAAGEKVAGGACSLIDASIATAVLGGTARGPVQNGGAANLDQCQYMHDGERVIDVRTATVQILPADLATMRSSLGEYAQGVEDVAGVGDAAIWIPQMGALYVSRGGHTLSFSVTAPNVDAKSKSIELARAGMAKL